MGADPVVVMPLVALVPLLRATAARLDPAHEAAGLGGGAFVAVSMPMAFYASSGLETVPYALCLTAAVAALLWGQARAFVGLPVLAWTLRPEAALLGLCGLLWFATTSARPVVVRHA